MYAKEISQEGTKLTESDEEDVASLISSTVNRSRALVGLQHVCLLVNGVSIKKHFTIRHQKYHFSAVLRHYLIRLFE